METYIVRVWSGDELAARGDGVRGVVQHVASGRVRSFAGFEQLRDFLDGRAMAQAGTDSAGAQDRRRKDP
jgi:hypothetical protein